MARPKPIRIGFNMTVNSVRITGIDMSDEEVLAVRDEVENAFTAAMGFLLGQVKEIDDRLGVEVFQ